MREIKKYIIVSVFVIGFLTIINPKQIKAYTYNISTNPVSSYTGVSGTGYGYYGQVVYFNIWDSDRGNSLKSGSISVYKNGNPVSINMSQSYFSADNYCNWGNVPMIFYQTGEYTYTIDGADKYGSRYNGSGSFYIYDITPVISLHPVNKSVKEGTSVTFSTAVSSGTNVTYQWYYNTTGSNTAGYKIAGATSSSYTVPSSMVTSSINGRYYFCAIKNDSRGGGVYTTNVAKLTLLYEVKYNVNGGTGTPSSQTKTHGTTLTLSNTKPTRTGYTFKGWSTSSTATSAIYQPGGSYTSNSSTTLYAVWEINKYTVYYNANGGTGAPSSQTKTYGNTLYLSGTKPIRTGYTFKGWSTNSNATSATYQAGGSYTSNSSTTLYAVWEIDKYTVSYNANGGTGAPSSQTKTYGNTLYISSIKPTRTGYTFKGWSTSSTAISAIYQPGDSYTSNSGTTLYAVWQKNPDKNNIGNDNNTSSSNGANNGSNNSDGKNNNSSNQNANTIKKQTIMAKSKTVTKGSKAFNLNAIKNGDGKLTYSSSNKKVVVVTSSGKVIIKGVGNASITIKASGTLHYTAAVKKITITVVPKKTTIKKVYSTGRKRLSASWKIDKTVTGYQVHFSTRKDFKRDTYERAFKKSTTKMNIVGLKSGKIYYVRVRSYVGVGKKKYYSTWSKAKSVKIK